MATYEEFVRNAAGNPDLLIQFMDDPDRVASELALDAAAVYRLRSLSPSIQRILLATQHDISQVATAIGRLTVSTQAEAFTDDFTDISSYTNKYTNSSPKELEIMFGLERRSAI